MSIAARIVAIAIIYCTLPLNATAQFFDIPLLQTELLFAGDVMQHQNQLDEARTGNGTYSYSGYYRYIKSVVQGADIAVANLETPIGNGNYSGYPSFCAPDSFLYAIQDAGFDVILFANNHCLDRGKSGAIYTLNLLDSLGIAHCGVYRNAEERATKYPLLVETNGIRIAILNYTYGTNGRSVPEPMVVNLIDKDIIAEDIIRAKAMNVDAIIACMHWGDEYVSLPPENVRKLSDWLLEQGVSHIIGNHPHVIQPIELRESKTTPDRHLVVYSTGNLVSNMSLRSTDGGIMVAMSLKKILNYTRPTNVRYLLTWIAPKSNDGKRDFTIYPATTTLITDWDYAEQKRRLFINDSRSLLNKHNWGNIKEMEIDSVLLNQ